MKGIENEEYSNLMGGLQKHQRRTHEGDIRDNKRSVEVPSFRRESRKELPLVTEFVDSPLPKIPASTSTPALLRSSKKTNVSSEVPNTLLKLFGEVKMYNAAKGFGFFTQDSTLQDIFFHVSDLEKAGIKPDLILKGTKASFQLSTTNGKSKAINIALI